MQVQVDNEMMCCCSICLEEKIEDDDMYEIKECHHKYHKDCLLDYYRVTGVTRCPMCRNDVVKKKNKKEKMRVIMNYVRRKNANEMVVKMVGKYREEKRKYEEKKKELREWNKKNKDLLKERSDIVTKACQSYRKSAKMRKELEKIVILPLVVIRK